MRRRRRARSNPDSLGGDALKGFAAAVTGSFVGSVGGMVLAPSCPAGADGSKEICGPVDGAVIGSAFGTSVVFVGGLVTAAASKEYRRAALFASGFALVSGILSRVLA